MTVSVISTNCVPAAGDLRAWFRWCAWVLREFKVCPRGYTMSKFNNVVDSCSLLSVLLHGTELLACTVVASYSGALNHGTSGLLSTGTQPLRADRGRNAYTALRNWLQTENGEFKRRRDRRVQRRGGRPALLPAGLRVFSERSRIRHAHCVHKTQAYEHPGTKLQRGTSSNDAERWSNRSSRKPVQVDLAGRFQQTLRRLFALQVREKQ